MDSLRPIFRKSPSGLAFASGWVFNEPSCSMRSTTWGLLPSEALVTTSTSSFMSLRLSIYK